MTPAQALKACSTQVDGLVGEWANWWVSAWVGWWVSGWVGWWVGG